MNKSVPVVIGIVLCISSIILFVMKRYILAAVLLGCAFAVPLLWYWLNERESHKRQRMIYADVD